MVLLDNDIYKNSIKSGNKKESDLLKEQLDCLENYNKTNPEKIDEIVKDKDVSFGVVKAIYMKDICNALA